MSMLGALEDIVGWLKKLAKPLQLLFAPIIGFLTVAYAIITYGMQLLSRIFLWVDERIASLDLTVAGHHLDSVATDFWVTVNTFIPLDLIFVLGTTLIVLRGVMAVLRIIKSLIPTVA